MADPTCAHGCRMVPLVPNLWLCEHAAYGFLTNTLGAVDEARRLLERAGGYRQLRRQLDEQAEQKRKERVEARAEGRARMRSQIKEHA